MLSIKDERLETTKFVVLEARIWSQSFNAFYSSPFNAADMVNP